MINLTPIAARFMRGRVKAADTWTTRTEDVQRAQLSSMVARARDTLWGLEHGYSGISGYEDYRRVVPVQPYEPFRPYVMRMVQGERDILWPGRTNRFAQSSGTSGGKSKYIPLTDESLKVNHYAGSRDVVAHYLHLYPDSRLFSGKAFILGGSYANELDLPPGVCVGDLSASLIDNISPLANIFRVPSKKVALMKDWTEKLPALVEASLHQDITNISGVPSWFLTVLKGIISRAGATTIHDVWPNLEVFFHGGISFKPYRREYESITDTAKMRYLETYNASEGFFATQSAIDDPAMLLLMDIGVFYEFVPLDQIDEPFPEALGAWQVEPGRTYALVITARNGLWRYAIGDTVRVESVNPVKITIAGRTQTYINAFGEEVMVYNTDAALSRACESAGATALNYTAGPVYTHGSSKGRHQWMVEWSKAPADLEAFVDMLDIYLQQENSDYQAKRSGGIFLDRLEIITVPPGTFDAWLASTGKLGGQRKVPRLSNDRRILEALQSITDKQILNTK